LYISGTYLLLLYAVMFHYIKRLTTGSLVRSFHQGWRLTVGSLSTCLQPPPALRPRHGLYCLFIEPSLAGGVFFGIFITLFTAEVILVYVYWCKRAGIKEAIKRSAWAKWPIGPELLLIYFKQAGTGMGQDILTLFAHRHI